MCGKKIDIQVFGLIEGDTIICKNCNKSKSHRIIFKKSQIKNKKICPMLGKGENCKEEFKKKYFCPFNIQKLT